MIESQNVDVSSQKIDKAGVFILTSCRLLHYFDFAVIILTNKNISF